MRVGSTIFWLLIGIVASATAGCQNFGTPKSPRGADSLGQGIFQVGLQEGNVATRHSRNSVRVIVTDTGAVSLGAPTDEFGLALAANREQLDLSGLPLSSELYGKEIYRSQMSSDLSLSGGGQSGDISVSSNRFVVIYEWSRYGSVSHSKPDLAEYAVLQGNYGFAIRLVLDVQIVDTSATADLNIGPGNLDAALALGIATVSAKYQAIGTSVSFLPRGDVDIRSAEDLAQVTREFHESGRRLEKTLAECGKILAYDNQGDAIQKTDESGNIITPNDNPQCAHVENPKMLSYISFGTGVGDSFRDYANRSAQCEAYRVRVQALTLKQADSKKGNLSRSDWKRLKRARARYSECIRLLEALTVKAVRQKEKSIEGTEPLGLDEIEPNESEPNESEPNESEPNESEPNESEPNESEPNESEPKKGETTATSKEPEDG